MNAFSAAFYLLLAPYAALWASRPGNRPEQDLFLNRAAMFSGALQAFVVALSALVLYHLR